MFLRGGTAQLSRPIGKTLPRGVRPPRCTRESSSRPPSVLSSERRNQSSAAAERALSTGPLLSRDRDRDRAASLWRESAPGIFSLNTRAPRTRVGCNTARRDRIYIDLDLTDRTGPFLWMALSFCTADAHCTIEKFRAAPRGRGPPRRTSRAPTSLAPHVSPQRAWDRSDPRRGCPGWSRVARAPPRRVRASARCSPSLCLSTSLPVIGGLPAALGSRSNLGSSCGGSAV